MCTVCGCGTATQEGDKSRARRRRKPQRTATAIATRMAITTTTIMTTRMAMIITHDHDHSHDHDHHHDHDHDHAHAATGENLDFGAGLAGVHVPGLSQERIVQIERDILSKNRSYAERKPRLFRPKGRPGAQFRVEPRFRQDLAAGARHRGSQSRHAIAVIEGDQQTSNDAERIRATGVKAIQVNTGKGCHLDAHMVGHALETLEPRRTMR